MFCLSRLELFYSLTKKDKLSIYNKTEWFLLMKVGNISTNELFKYKEWKIYIKDWMGNKYITNIVFIFNN